MDNKKHLPFFERLTKKMKKRSTNTSSPVSTNTSSPVYKYTGLCSAKDRKRNRDASRAIWDMIRNDEVDRDLLEEAEQQVKRFLEKLREGIEKRKRTISMLGDIASELEKTQKDVNIAKVTGTSTAVAGGVIAGIGGVLSIFTFGLASPLIGLGVGTAVAGGVTAGGAEIADVVISKGKMEDAQRIMDDDKKTLDEIDMSYAALDRIAEKISASDPKKGTKEQILCSLLIGSKLKGGGKGSNQGKIEFALAFGLMVSMGALLAGSIASSSGKVAARLTTRIARVFGRGMARGASSVARAVLRGAAAVAAGVFLAFDIYELVQVSKDIHNGSKSKAAEALRKIATGLQDQLREMEEFFDELEMYADELWERMKTEFRKLLEEIASRGQATAEEVAMVWRYLQMCQPSEEWCQAFRKYVSSPQLYVSSMATIFTVIQQRIEEEEEKEKKKPVIEMDITFIAHGQITSPMLPCTLYYLSPPSILGGGVESITLYEPWGCAVDASAVYGIATGLINNQNVRYSDTVLPSRPTHFNTLPRDATMIPMALFTHVKTDESAYLHLMAIAAAISASSRGLVIPYFQSPSDTDLPEIPLWALANVVDVIGLLTGIRFKIHVAACLVTEDESILCRAYPSQLWPTVNCNQYCTVPVKLPNPPNEPVHMSCGLPVPPQLSGALACLDKLL